MYWIILSPILFFFSAVHPWDSLPETYGSTTWLLIISIVIFSLAIWTFRKWKLHLLTVSVLLLVGAFFYARNEGLILEKPDQNDLRILERTAEILSDSSAWDRSDERTCTTDATSFTLYCALKQASYDVTGGFRHRSPALQIVRMKITAIDTANAYGHRLS